MKNTILETILLTDGYKLDHRRQYPEGTASWKKSLKGLCKVVKEDGKFKVIDQVSKFESTEGWLRPVFINGQLQNETNLNVIRHNVTDSIYSSLNNDSK